MCVCKNDCVAGSLQLFMSHAFIYMYVYVYVYVYAYAYVYVYVHVYLWHLQLVDIYIYMYIYTHIYPVVRVGSGASWISLVNFAQLLGHDRTGLLSEAFNVNLG